MYAFIRRYGVAVCMVFSFAFIHCVGLSSQEAQDGKETQIGSASSKAHGVTAIRMVNTAEARFHAANKRYASWEELSHSPALADAKPAVPDEYRLSIVVSGDGQQYALSMLDMSGDKCGRSFFSDQRGVIYKRRAYQLSCRNRRRFTRSILPAIIIKYSEPAILVLLHSAGNPCRLRSAGRPGQSLIDRSRNRS